MAAMPGNASHLLDRLTAARGDAGGNADTAADSRFRWEKKNLLISSS